jgi:hypothetical protein
VLFDVIHRKFEFKPDKEENMAAETTKFVDAQKQLNSKIVS